MGLLHVEGDEVAERTTRRRLIARDVGARRTEDLLDREGVSAVLTLRLVVPNGPGAGGALLGLRADRALRVRLHERPDAAALDREAGEDLALDGLAPLLGGLDADNPRPRLDDLVADVHVGLGHEVLHDGPVRHQVLMHHVHEAAVLQEAMRRLPDLVVAGPLIVKAGPGPDARTLAMPRSGDDAVDHRPVFGLDELALPANVVLVLLTVRLAEVELLAVGALVYD